VSQQKQPRARCLFCDAEGVSKEHIFAKSLTDLFPGHGVVRHAYEPPEGGRPRPVKRAETFAYISRKFCRDCNSGWMQESDEAVRHLLAAFATNQAVKLSPAEQEALALWATKVALGFLSIEPEEYQFASSDQYHEVYRQRTPFAGSQVWLGANEHGEMGWAGSHSLLFQEQPPNQERGFGVSVSFGYAVFHLMHHGRTDRRLRLRMEAHQALKQIWPAQEVVSWPPPLRIRPHDLEPLANIINANSTFVPVNE
jgi:hypothetical protein